MSGCTATPCPECPWRTSNHGRRHPGGFFTKRNRQRLWNNIRGGGNQQSCHLTDPSHPDHIEHAGVDPERPREKIQECMGSVVLVVRELKHLERLGGGEATPEAIDAYLETRRRIGLKRDGLIYNLLGRIVYAGAPMGEPALPNPPAELLADPTIGTGLDFPLLITPAPKQEAAG